MKTGALAWMLTLLTLAASTPHAKYAPPRIVFSSQHAEGTIVIPLVDPRYPANSRAMRTRSPPT